jgi:UDP-N-acetylmuramoyl-L-alanyl-D-glutamate--2,6-diaminopimelate ligase
MQRVVAGNDLPTVFVDYAHTPDAIGVALRALKSHCTGKLWCVFGCGGDRDSGKRPQMGRVAERYADRLIATNDNPRSEDPAAIIAGIIAGVVDPDQVTVIEDRAAAIAFAIREAAADDIVLIAGKGHENYQLLGNERLDFSDYAVASGNLSARSGACK